MTPPIPDPGRQVETERDDANAGATIPLTALAASLVLHGLLFLALLHGPLPGSIQTPDNGVITMRLVPHRMLGAEPPESPNPSESQLRNEPQEEPDTPAPNQPQATIAGTEPGRTSEPEDVEVDTAPPDAAALRARILGQVGALQAEEQSGAESKMPWTTSGERLPGLPGTRGWISGHIGRVQPSAHTWKENDGSSRGRYVLANGTVVCTHRRAPTIDELMNPWKSIAVTMGSICGRERPPAPDFDDPRVQPPPARVQAGRDD